MDMPYFGRQNELFTDGYREPGDECERLSYVIGYGVSLLIGLCFVVSGTGLLISRQQGSLEPVLSLLLGGACCFFSIRFFIREVPKWDFRELKADRIVAGMFLFGLALMFLGLRSYGPYRFHSFAQTLETAGLLILGSSVVLISLFIGTIFALAEKIGDRKRVLRNLRIIRRYAVDERCVEYEDHPCPSEDGMRGMVEVVTADGRSLTLVAAPTAYDLSDPGKVGQAVVRGGRMQNFSINH